MNEDLIKSKVEDILIQLEDEIGYDDHNPNHLLAHKTALMHIENLIKSILGI